MCTIPPPPPPPPTVSPTINKGACVSKSETIYRTDICEWASSDIQLWEVCVKNEICYHKPPFLYTHTKFEPILQVGPTCGLVALSMYLKGAVTPDELLNIGKMEGFSSIGEMLSCKNMAKLAEKAISLAEIENISFTLKKGNLFSHETIQELLNGAVLLVPYDPDFNYSPTLRQGHTAHWALICGVIITEDPGDLYTSNPNNVYVLARQGKSKYLAAWSLEQLHNSNANLWEFSPKKAEDGILYIIPDGGIGSEDGLRDQFLMFYHSK